jgi:hypothetical protein
MTKTTFLPCRVTGKNLQIVVKANMAAGVGSSLYALSCVGPGQSIRAVAAAMRAGDRATFEIPLSTQSWYHGDGKFVVRYAKLAYDHWHLLGVTVNPNFILNCTDETLWRLLRSDKYTTPLLKSWTPAIREALVEVGGLKKVRDAHGCDPWFCYAGDAELDVVVAEGVRTGKLKMEDL